MSRVTEYWGEDTQTWLAGNIVDSFPISYPDDATYVKTDDGWTLCIQICTIYDETPEDFTLDGAPHLHILRYKDE